MAQTILKFVFEQCLGIATNSCQKLLSAMPISLNLVQEINVELDALLGCKDSFP